MKGYFVCSKDLLRSLIEASEALADEKQKCEKQAKMIVRLQKQLVDKEQESQRKDRMNKVLELKIEGLQSLAQRVAELREEKVKDDETIAILR